MGKKGNALVALGLAGAAYWLFKMKPEDKQKIKDQVSNLKNGSLDKIPGQIKDTFNKLKNKNLQTEE